MLGRGSFCHPGCTYRLTFSFAQHSPSTLHYSISVDYLVVFSSPLLARLTLVCFQKAKEQRENETKTNRTTILKTDEVMSFDKDREVKQHLNLNNTAEREKVTRSVAFLRVF